MDRDVAEMKHRKGHKRKALDAGIQNQKAENAAPGSAEVRKCETLFPSSSSTLGASFFSKKKTLCLRVRVTTVSGARLHRPPL